MHKKGSHCTARISGLFISFIVLLSGCSDKENTTTAEPPSKVSIAEQIVSAEDSVKNAPISKHPPFSQLVLKKISIDYPYTPEPSFSSYINKLRARIDNKNMRTMQMELSPHFICLGSACSEGLPIKQQFESLVMGLGDQPWKVLLKMIKTKYYQQVNGHICGPARTNFIGDGREKVAGKNWGYVNGKDVRLRKKPTTRAGVVTYLSHDAAILLSRPKRNKRGRQWVEIETLKGKKGFIVEKYFMMLNPQQICYQELDGHWKISAFRSP